LTKNVISMGPNTEKRFEVETKPYPISVVGKDPGLKEDSQT
jgi:hypothetical protein